MHRDIFVIANSAKTQARTLTFTQFLTNRSLFGQGYATAEMLSSPSGFSILEYDNITGRGSTASLTDGMGRATFSGLFIKEAGEGFICRFVAFNSAGVGVAWTDSEPFDVGVGEPYAIALSTPVGRMDGGSIFDNPPVISIQVGFWVRCCRLL